MLINYTCWKNTYFGTDRGGKMKWLLAAVVFLFMVNSVNADSVYDRTVTVLDKSRDEKVKEVFRDLIAAYVDEDARTFFDNVSEDRFIQDYITFSDAVYNDFRLYDIMQVDYWFEGVIPLQQVGRIVTVRWQERYESLESSEQYEAKGLSRFTFDEIDGKYYLVQVEGNNLFGISLPEWREEVPPIAGQESQLSQDAQSSDDNVVSLPDVQIIDARSTCAGSTMDSVYFDIKNIGNATASGTVDYTVRIVSNLWGTDITTPGSVTVDLSSNASMTVQTDATGAQDQDITVTITPQFADADSTNHVFSFYCP